MKQQGSANSLPKGLGPGAAPPSLEVLSKRAVHKWTPSAPAPFQIQVLPPARNPRSRSRPLNAAPPHRQTSLSPRRPGSRPIRPRNRKRMLAASKPERSSLAGSRFPSPRRRHVVRAHAQAPGPAVCAAIGWRLWAQFETWRLKLQLEQGAREDPGKGRLVW